MQPNVEKNVNLRNKEDQGLFGRLDSVAEKSRRVYDHAIEDFRNNFTLGHQKFDYERDED